MSESAGLSCPESWEGMPEELKSGNGYHDFSYSPFTLNSYPWYSFFFNNEDDFEKKCTINALPFSKNSASYYSASKKIVSKILDQFYKSHSKSRYDTASDFFYLINFLKNYELLNIHRQRTYKIQSSFITSISPDKKIPFYEPNNMQGEYLSGTDSREKQEKNEDSLIFIKGTLPKKIWDSVINDFYEPGMISPLEKYLTDSFEDEDSGKVQRIMYDLYQYATKENNHKLLVNVLIVLSELPLSIINNETKKIVCKALKNSDPELEELGIRCFENWEDKEGINILKKYSFNESWLDDYAKSVCEYLESL